MKKNSFPENRILLSTYFEFHIKKNSNSFLSIYPQKLEPHLLWRHTTYEKSFVSWIDCVRCDGWNTQIFSFQLDIHCVNIT